MGRRAACPQTGFYRDADGQIQQAGHTRNDKLERFSWNMVRVLHPVGILDGMNGNQLRQAIHDRIAAGDRIFLVDCKEITFTDSAGLAALVMALRKLREVSGRLCLCMINQQLEMLLKLTDLTDVFEVFSNQTEFQHTLYAEQP